ncbi:ATP-dependent helicase [Leekyejoonella antrihumi]|uniref:DNA 3'-5' helicase n=2 Tax=Leekyejoonella antrihumi TaxID=1660198 RepID=A0A563DUX6_9MICO|nr:ATP-dependent helicase [Leekyejoonella antrihumi]
MRRAADVAVGAPVLDDVQQDVVDSTTRARLVLGAPGTGKSTLAVEAVVSAVDRGLRPDECLLLAPTRVQASALRDRVTARLQGTSTEPVARTHQALGFGILRQHAALHGDPAPRLLSGPEQDVVLRELLAGHQQGDGTPPTWPSFVREALETRGFRAQLRDLLMRAVEWGLTADDLRELGVHHDRSEWVAAAQVLNEYDQVTALSRPGAYDPAWILGAAADLLVSDDEALARLHSGTRLVVVDDAQELTHAAARLLRLVVGPAARVVLIADPDAAVQGFRGADPHLVMDLADEWQVADTQVLPTCYRAPERVRAACERVTSRIGAVAGAAHRTPVARPGGRVEVALLRAVSQEAAHIAAHLRRAHLQGGVPWQEMAVIVRGQGRAATLRRALAGAGVPVSVPPTVVPLRDEPAVRPLLALFEVVLREAAGEQAPVSPQIAIDVLTSPLGGADAVALRRMRRAMRGHELASGGQRSSDELLADAITDTGWLALLGPQVAPARRVARVARAGLAARQQSGAGAESILWAMWDASGLAAAWSETALAGGPAGARADRDLDAVVALFQAAAAFTDRLPGTSPAAFLEHVRGQDVPGDRLTAAAPEDECVALRTPQSAVGREWSLVVVAGVQEGVWPDLRLRGSLLGSESLVDVLSGRGDSLRAAQAAVRYDETRQFLVAISRARDRLIVTAVRSDDEQPSPYLDLVDPLDATGDDHLDQLRGFCEVAPAMTLPATVAQLRRELATGDERQRAEAAGLLGHLAHERVPGADPSSWWALTTLSDDRPVRRSDQEVAVSPSKVEAFGTCGVNWLLTACGGQGPDVGAATVGTLVHEIAAELGDSAPEQMHGVLDQRWPRLGLGAGWISDRKRDEAHQMLDRLTSYLDESRAQGWDPVGVEVPFDVLLGRARVRGRVDRIEAHAREGLRIVDLKTGGGKPTAEELPEHAQLGTYQVAIEEGGFEQGEHSAGAVLVQLGKAGRTGGKAGVQSQAPLAEQDDPRWAHALVEQVAEGMGAATFVATIGKRCDTCSVRRCCPLQPEGGAL